MTTNLLLLMLMLLLEYRRAVVVGSPSVVARSVGVGTGIGAEAGAVAAVVIGVSFSVGGWDEVHGHFGVADSLGLMIAAGTLLGVRCGRGRGQGGE